jgi:L-fuculose-phosphate aldolase
MHEDFARVGHDLWISGAVSSHGGNMSARVGEDRLLITRSGSQLGHLGPDDIVETTVGACDDPRDERCSVELVVHRAIYARTDARAIVHAHTIHTIVRSLVTDSIVPPDSESLLRLTDVPVVVARESIGSAEAGDRLAEALKERRIAVLRGHGPFARGETLEEAFQAVSCLEASCEMLDWLDAIGKPAV